MTIDGVETIVGVNNTTGAGCKAYSQSVRVDQDSAVRAFLSGNIKSAEIPAARTTADLGTPPAPAVGDPGDVTPVSPCGDADEACVQQQQGPSLATRLR
jgi:hypothetical protein